MAKGFVIGAIWGGVVAVGGAAGLSVMTGPVAETGFPSLASPDAATGPAVTETEVAADPGARTDGGAADGPAVGDGAPDPDMGVADADVAAGEPAGDDRVADPVTAAGRDLAPVAGEVPVPEGLAPDGAAKQGAETAGPAPEADTEVPGSLAAPEASAASGAAAGARPGDPRPGETAAQPLAEAAPDPVARVPERGETTVQAGDRGVDLTLAPAEPEEDPAPVPEPLTEVARSGAPAGVPDPGADDAAPDGSGTAPPADPAVGDTPEAPPAAGAEVADTLDLAALTPVEPVSPLGQGAAPQASPGAPDPEAEPQISADPGLPPKPVEEGPGLRDDARGTAAENPAALTDAPETAEDGAGAVRGGPEIAKDAPEALTEAPEIAEDGPDVVRDAPETAEEDPKTAEDAEQGRLQTRAGSLVSNREPAVQQNRLPSIAADAPESPGAQPDAPEAAASALAALPEDSPLVRNAAAFEAPAGVPRMAVVLIDDGSGPLGPEALESFPFRVTFAIAPGHPDPQGAAAGYRALGFEVMAVGAVPAGALPSDVEVALAGALSAVPQAVGVLEDSSGSFQADRDVAAQTTDYLLASGHGLVMMPKGLNTAQKLALKEGVPSASLFRDFDAEGQSASVIRRIFDQAAFRARQEGAVVMLGRLRADTVSALVLWGLQDRGSTITLVPISTVLAESLRAVE
ncbi:divergent polysaccharide deacteylase family protein [Ponticoccus alexandrii]|uniref:Divergent polysaccharide deacetylase n=1 Tax=Ponticoccus alexandrii TaxID=1943633 RepID=A0ABX7F9V9_9RHOB|nr:divergent polysaccharide deacteylase family protein [Ponticoccus alexandrii]QRF66339.1 hypothetical protein GQA70_08460 [Ponticoccus alexandrii]